MTQKSIRRNYIFNVVYQMLTLITPLIIAPYLSRVLEPDGIGTVSYVESVVTYFSMFAAMGITTYGQREISYVQDDLIKRSTVFWNTKLLGVCTAAATLLIYIAFALFQEYRSIYLVLSLNIVAVLVDVTWFFQGVEEFGKIVVRNIILKCLQVVYVFLFVRQARDLLVYVLGMGLFTALGNLSLWSYLPRYIQKIPWQELHPFRNMKVVWSLFVPTIAIQIYTVLDKTMIGLITRDSFENGYYEQAIKIPRVLLGLIMALDTVMATRVGYYFRRENYDKIEQMLYWSYRFVWFLGIPMCLGLISIADNIVPWFFGAGFEKVTGLLKILSFLILAVGINGVTGGQFLIPTKRQNLFTWSVVIGACVNFCLNVILICLYQSSGAAIASVVAETVIAAVQLILIRSEFSIRNVLREGIPYYIAGAVMMFILWPVGELLSPSPMHTAFIIFCGMTVYFGVLFFERDEFFLSNVSHIIHAIRCRLKQLLRRIV